MTSDIQSAYDKWSETYDTQENPTRDLDKDILQARLTHLADKTIVEMGCGTGKNTVWIAPQCQRLVALDFSTGMMALARQKVDAPNVSFIRANFLNPIPLSSNLADVVIINLVLEHIEDLEPVLREAHRIMKTGAIIIISELHPSRIKAGYGAVIEATEEFVGTFVHTMEDFINAFNAAGFDSVTLSNWYWSYAPRGSGNPPLVITYEATKI